MPTSDAIKHFVQNTLGCGCPEEVFRSIDVREQVPLSGTIILHVAMIIGNWLLIYVIHADTPSVVRENLEFLVQAGTQERDRKNLNRFRLVVVTDDSTTGSVTQDLFHRLSGKDEKVHLHVIPQKEMLLATEEKSDASAAAAD
jgi:hypothetical protein